MKESGRESVRGCVKTKRESAISRGKHLGVGSAAREHGAAQRWCSFGARSGGFGDQAGESGEAAGVRVAVIAGEVEEILSIPRDQVKPAPESARQTPQEWVLGVHDDNRLLLRMDQILQDTKLVNWKKA